MGLYLSGVGSTSLPLDLSNADQILASSALIEWFDSDHYTLGTAPAVQTLTSRKSGGRTLDQVTASKRPVLTPAAIGPSPVQYGEITFAGASVMRLSTTPDLSQPYTWAFVLRLPASSAGASIFDNQQTTSQRSSLVMTTGGLLAFAHGNGLAAVPAAPTAGWHFVVVGHHGTTVSIALDGGAPITAATDNNVATNALCLGSTNSVGVNFLTGGIADILMLSGSPTSNAALIKLLKTYARTAYGSSVSIG